jgi:hypothetical protein
VIEIRPNDLAAVVELEFTRQVAATPEGTRMSTFQGIDVFNLQNGRATLIPTRGPQLSRRVLQGSQGRARYQPAHAGTLGRIFEA